MIPNVFSKSFKSLFFLILFVGFSSAFAERVGTFTSDFKLYSQYQARDIINEKIGAQSQLIMDRTINDSLTRSEHAQMHAMNQYIRLMQIKRLNLQGGGGSMRESEYWYLTGMLDLANSRIQVASEKPYPGPVAAADEVSRRGNTQDRRIADWKAKGKLNPAEEADLNRSVSYINSFEAFFNSTNWDERIKGTVKTAGSGNIGEDEYNYLIEMLEFLSNKINKYGHLDFN